MLDLLLSLNPIVLHWIVIAAKALGDPTMTIDEVTPPIAPSGDLPPAEVPSNLELLAQPLIGLKTWFLDKR